MDRKSQRINLPNCCGHELFLELIDEKNKKIRILPQSEDPTCKECQRIIDQFAHMLKYKAEAKGVKLEGNLFENV